MSSMATEEELIAVDLARDSEEMQKVMLSGYWCVAVAFVGSYRNVVTL